MPKSSLRVMTLCGALTLSAGAYAAMTYATPLLSNEPSVTRAVAAADAVVFSGERGVARSEDGAEYRRQGTYVGDGFRTFQHVHYQRFHEGLRVIGGGTTVTADEYGEVTDINTRGPEGRMKLDTTDAKLTAKQIADIAAKKFAVVDKISEPEKVIFADGQAPTIAYEVKVDGARRMDGEIRESHVTYHLDANTGAVIDDVDLVVYEAANTAHNGRVELDTRGSWRSNTARGWDCKSEGAPLCGGPSSANGQDMDLATACNDVAYAVENEVRMLKEWMGRDQVNGRGSTPISRVGMSKVNAFWNGRYTQYDAVKAAWDAVQVPSEGDPQCNGSRPTQPAPAPTRPPWPAPTKTRPPWPNPQPTQPRPTRPRPTWPGMPGWPARFPAST